MVMVVLLLLMMTMMTIMVVMMVMTVVVMMMMMMAMNRRQAGRQAVEGRQAGSSRRAGTRCYLEQCLADMLSPTIQLPATIVCHADNDGQALLLQGQQVTH